MQLILFYIFSSVAIFSAIFVVASKRPTRALLSLIVTMFALAVIYLQLGAAFVAMAHLIVYAGAVLVLFLFVIMLQGVGAQEPGIFQRFSAGQVFLSVLTAASFLALVVNTVTSRALPAAAGVFGTVEAVGKTLLTSYLLPFELTSFLLLIGVFAAVSLAKREES